MGIVVGCDVSRDWIDVQIVGPDLHRELRLANESRAIEDFARELPAGTLTGMEATGQMHELLACALHRQGHRVFVINPRWIRMYARAIGARGKSDRTDAALIARYTAAESGNLHAYEPAGVEQQELRKLLLQRLEVVKLKTAARMSLGAQSRELCLHFDRILYGIESRIARIISHIPHWQDLAKRLSTSPGIGPLVSAHLVQVLTRIPFATADAFVAHTGLDPRPNDSGQKRGRRRLTHHGDAALRTMLFMAAMTACRQPEWRAIYEAHRGKGLPSTAAYVVVARKLARVAFGLFKSGRSYDPERLSGLQTS